MDAELQQFISMIEPVDGDFARSMKKNWLFPAGPTRSCVTWQDGWQPYGAVRAMIF